MTTGEKIRQLRIDAGMTQEDLGKAARTTKQNIYKYETGIITNIPAVKIGLIAKALNTTPAYLMGWDEEETKTAKASIDLRAGDTGLLKLPDGTYPYNPDLHRIPILGSVSAGTPLYAEQNIEGYTWTDLNGEEEYFALRVKGNSMNAAQINDGNILIVRKQTSVVNGEVAVVMVGDNDAVVKRFYQNGDTVTLVPQSTDPNFLPQIYNLRETRIKVIGRVMRNQIDF